MMVFTNNEMSRGNCPEASVDQVVRRWRTMLFLDVHAPHVFIFALGVAMKQSQ